MKKTLRLLSAVLIIPFLLSLQPVEVSATQYYYENAGTTWLNLRNNTDNTRYLLHNSANNGGLEFAVNNNGSTIWQVLNIRKDGKVAVGNSLVSEGIRFQVNSTITEWAGKFANNGSDVRLAYPGYGIFVSTTSMGGEYLIQLNKNTTPIFSVHSNGTAYLSGTLKAKEIQVKSNVWADYVFEPDYKLMKLNDLESFIKENKHLPNIPTTEEVKEKGINVSEMQAKQMEKIEELTLYILSQQKEIEMLKNDLEILKYK